MIRLGVHEAGDRDGSPMLLLHGFLSCNAQWALNQEALGAHHRLVMVELPGHGRSDAPEDVAAYGVGPVIAALESIREERGIDRWWVVGQSLGAAVVTRYALSNRERFLGLVITNSRAVFGVARRGSEDGDPSMTYDRVRDLRYHPIHASRLPAAVKDPLVAAADSMPRHVIEHITSHRDKWRSADELHELAMPVLLVNGRWESRFQPSVAIARQAIPDLTVVDLEGGHSINAEQADEFNRAVLDFTSLRSGGAKA